MSDELSSATDVIDERWAKFGDMMGAPVGEFERDVARARLRSELFDEPRQVTTLGRYVLLERRGAGAMGVVYAAYDPELGRKVAIKVISTRGREGTGEHRQRLLREAQALAKLGHPNVVAVHDAGTIADGD
jgi:serine/threonine protein kinase